MKALVVIGAHSETAVRVRDRVGFKWFSNVSHSFNYGYLFSVLIIGFTVFQVIVWCILSLACHMSSKFHEHPRLPSSSVLMGLGLSKLYLSLLWISSIWHRSPFVVFFCVVRKLHPIQSDSGRYQWSICIPSLMVCLCRMSSCSWFLSLRVRELTGSYCLQTLKQAKECTLTVFQQAQHPSKSNCNYKRIVNTWFKQCTLGHLNPTNLKGWLN